MYFVEGESLNAFWTRWEASTSEADEAKQRSVLRQLAAIWLELYRARFDKTGRLTRAADGSWAVTQRPLAYDMSTKTFVAHLRRQQLCLSNINLPGTWDAEGFFAFQTGSHIDMEHTMATASDWLLSRHAMDLPDYAAHLHGDNGPYAIFCPDLSRVDILADPATGLIIAVLDLEFTNTMHATFTQGPSLGTPLMTSAGCIERGLFSTWQDLPRGIFVIRWGGSVYRY
ncbi:hypothetical protein SPBR_01994 [Sporothrix brasiliensis 5110]|uniref:Uncharacterized protein n=1 Tax=Sporothrix brasiliensis 5110 TaxID=1398154 RepID=A0A0C2IPQ8_9PEZI|nr:uncharacterized protein SPBR_01994 [Sporothrix brasiliensis 5110]KIH91011.1 hypothetical protein SPBR_01994 [Sporothrix brasiliensis 5110]